MQAVAERLRGELVVPSCRVYQVTPENIDEEDYRNLLLIADQITNKTVQRASARLKASVVAMHSTISGRIGQRWAVSFLPLLVILLGSLLAIRFANEMPLSVYAKVFVPAVIALLLIFSGGQMVRDERDLSGFLVMWSGNVGLLALVLFHWSKVRLT